MSENEAGREWDAVICECGHPERDHGQLGCTHDAEPGAERVFCACALTSAAVLRRALATITQHAMALKWHACLTGDCPHGDVQQCYVALARAIGDVDAMCCAALDVTTRRTA